MKRLMKMVIVIVFCLELLANIGLAAEMKTIVILAVHGKESLAKHALKALEEAGFVDQQNVTVTWAPASVVDDPAQLAAWVQASAADVLMNFMLSQDVYDHFESLSIPVLTSMGVERFVNAEGAPTANVTGVYSTLSDMVYNSYKFLWIVAPLKAGQQVVFLNNTMTPWISAEEAEEALNRLQIPLKAVVDATMYEQWQQAILQYNNDPGVGWVLYSIPPEKKLDGSPVDLQTDIYKWYREHAMKPMVTYWEWPVMEGALCGFGINSEERSKQVGRLAARVLQGEPIQSIKAEYPQKINIVLNRKTATNLGIVFSLDVLKLADVIYDDYEGKQVIRK